MAFNWGSFGSTPSTTAATPTSSAAPVGALFQTSGTTGTTTGTEQTAKQLTWSTQFEDLPPVMQQDLTKIQTRILEEKMRSDEIAQHSADPLPKVRSEVEVATERLNTLHNTLRGDMETVADIRNNVTKELKNAELAVRYIERLSANLPLLPQQNLALPPQYFRDLAASFEKRMEEYRHVISEVEGLRRHTQHKAYTPQMLQEILRNQYEALMAAAARVADLHDTAERAKEQFVALRNQATGGSETVEDLFEKEEKRRQRQKARLMPVATPAPAPAATPAPAAAATPAASSTPSTSLWPTSGGTAAGTAASTPFGFSGTSFTTPSTPTAATPSFPGFSTTPAAGSTPASLTSSLFGSSQTSSAGGLGFSTAGTALSFPTTPTPTTAASTAGRPSSSGRPSTGRKGGRK